MPARNGSDLIV